MTTTRDTRTIARCILKCASSSDGRAHEGARRQDRNAMDGNVDIIDDAVNAAWLVGRQIAFSADASHAALDASYEEAFYAGLAR